MRAVLSALLLLLLPSAATAAPDYRVIVAAAADQHVIPAFRRFSERAAALDTVGENFCRSPDAPGLEALRSGFHDAMDAWQGVQHLAFGPVEDFNRGQRVQFWPDKRGAGDRQMLALLKERQIDKLAPSRIIFASVAVQGLPALEMLLFGKGQPERLLAKGEDADFRCKVVTAVTENLAVIGRELVTEWEKPDGWRAAMVNAGAPASRYADTRQAASQLFNAIHAHLQAIAEVKLGEPLGGGPDEARPGRAESWRATRSLRNIQIDLKALRALFVAAFAPVVAAEKVGVDAHFIAALDQILAAVRQMPGPMEEALSSPEGWRRLSGLKAQVKAAARVLETTAGAALDLQIGFNALDGD